MEYHLRFFIDNVPGFSDSKFVRGLVTSFICVGISYISYLFIEKPSMGKLRIALERKAEISPAPEK
jgi:peptidoglycan/LPS O-acetylase OafA/YrhL